MQDLIFLIEGEITSRSVIIIIVISLIKTADNYLAFAAGGMDKQIIAHINTDMVGVPVFGAGEENKITDSKLTALNIGVLSILAGTGTGRIIAVMLENIGSKAGAVETIN